MFLTFIPLSAHSQATSAITNISKSQLASIGDKIYQNETGSNPEYLVAWNDGESFASVGIGHFIWFPEGLQSPFTETFPQLVEYLVAQGADVPQWLIEAKDCPWETKADFINAKRSDRMQDVKALMLSTFEHQIAFIHQRMQAALPKMVEHLDQKQADKTQVAEQSTIITTYFNQLAATELGLYSLIDYVNFKGEGTAASERYENQGWGLLQVLQTMHSNLSSKESVQPTDIHVAFSDACIYVLSRRVNNSPQQEVEQKWLAGWTRRCQTYAQ
jgi:hypothetical protein